MNLTEVNQRKSCFQSSNSSCSGQSTSPADILLYTSVAAVIFVTACGNLLVIISVCHFKQLHTPTNIILLSLAVADLLVGVIVMPFHFTVLLNPHWCFGIMLCTVYDVASFFLTCLSIYNVAFIAVDRYFALCNPFLYFTKMTVNLTLRIISILWLYSFIYNVLLYFTGNITDLKGNITCAECIVTVSEIWTIIDLIIVFIVPCTTIIIMYLKVFAIVKKHANKINCAKKLNSKGTKISNDSMASERKAAKTLGILVSVFLLCLIPFYISAFLNVYIRKPSVFLAIMNTTSVIYLNSMLNPIIYALFYPWFRKSFKLILTLKICGPETSLLNVLIKETCM